MLVLTHHDLRSVLDAREVSVLDAVRRAYVLHSQGATAVPRPAVLNPPEEFRELVARPAFLGGTKPAAGVAWQASAADDGEGGPALSAATIILNSAVTGRPEALLEGSLITARRTAAGAALAASALGTGEDAAGVTLVGCGAVGFETLRYLHVVHPDLLEVTVHDLRRERAGAFAARVARELPTLRVRFEPDRARALAAASLVVLSTRAAAPWLDTRRLRPGTLVLHTSLRDVTPESVLAAVNVVDDAEHACRADGSLALAERLSGNRSFLTANLGDLLLAGTTGVRDPRRTTIFSPAGLGVLDLAVARYARDRAEQAGLGVRIDDFLPARPAVLPGRADPFAGAGEPRPDRAGPPRVEGSPVDHPAGAAIVDRVTPAVPA